MKISNSQIMSFQKCEKKFYFDSVLKLRPLEYPDPMVRGIIGHEMFEIVFKAMQDGANYEDATKELNPYLQELVSSPNGNLGMSIYRHVLAYLAYAYQQPWKIVAVEENGLREVSDYDEFAFTPDLIIEWTEGPKRQSRSVLDYKFTAQYWNERKVNMFQQLPKYQLYRNEIDDIKIRSCGIVQLNTRAAAGATGTGLFLTKWITPPKAKLENIKRENEILIKRIAHARENYAPEDYVRTVDNHACSMCWFADNLCPMDLEGRDTSKVIERNYMVNTYFDDNYNKEDE